MQVTCPNYNFVIAFEKHSQFPTRKENQLENATINDLEIFIRDRAIPYGGSFYPVSKKMVNCEWDLTNEEIEKCKSDTAVMENENCFSQMSEDLQN